MPRVIELGCGNHPTPDYVHHDRWLHAPHVDVSFDLELLPWPLESASASKVLAIDVFEHLRLDVQLWLDEVWRILIPEGQLEMRLPAWDHHYSYRDPTHRRVFHHETFLFWCPGPESGTIWQDFGRYYFGQGYNRWWKQLKVWRDANDWRYLLQKA